MGLILESCMLARTLLVPKDYARCAAPAIGSFRKAADRRLKKKEQSRTFVNQARKMNRPLSTFFQPPPSPLDFSWEFIQGIHELFYCSPTSRSQFRERFRRSVFHCPFIFNRQFEQYFYLATFIDEGRHSIIENLIKKLKC